MFPLVFWVEEEQFSVVEAKDFVQDKSNGKVKESMTEGENNGKGEAERLKMSMHAEIINPFQVSESFL